MQVAQEDLYELTSRGLGAPTEFVFTHDAVCRLACQQHHGRVDAVWVVRDGTEFDRLKADRPYLVTFDLVEADSKGSALADQLPRFVQVLKPFMPEGLTLTGSFGQAEADLIGPLWPTRLVTVPHEWVPAWCSKFGGRLAYAVFEIRQDDYLGQLSRVADVMQKTKVAHVLLQHVPFHLDSDAIIGRLCPKTSKRAVVLYLQEPIGLSQETYARLAASFRAVDVVNPVCMVRGQLVPVEAV